MEKRISSCSAVRPLLFRRPMVLPTLLLLVALLLPASANAQNSYNNSRQGNTANRNQAKKKEKKEPEIVYPLYNGVSVGVDLWGLGSGLLGSDFTSSEVAVDVNLKNRYFPVVEIGYGSADGENDYGTTYKGKAPYFRIGMDYNALYNKKHGHQLRVGLRYAASSFKYDVKSATESGNPELEDDVWGGSLPYDYKGMKGSMQWAEFCVGIRARVSKNIYMGWAARFKFKLSAKPDEYGDPWYVPGFGKYGGNTLGITYHLVYKLPL